MKKKLLLMTVLSLTCLLGAKADVDPDFHIYLCFGQSNMEGNAQWETVDNMFVDERFQMLATTDFDSPKRMKGEWYTAFCPIVSPMGKLGPTDYFGRTMVAALPTNIKVGVVAVAMGGSPIEMFDKDKYEAKLKANPNEWWATLSKNYYGGNPYGRLIEMAQKAQESGVIKGILLHQGCSNNGDPKWPDMVKKIYNDILTDLNLAAEDVPIFVGETEYADMGGGCSLHNTVVAKIPSVIPTGHVVSAEGLPGNGQDAWHFSAAGYRTFGKRYAFEVLKLMGLETKANPDYTMPENLKNFFTPKNYNDYIQKRPGTLIPLTLTCTFADNHKENIKDAVFSSADYTITDGNVTLGEAGSKGTVTATFTDFFGEQHEVTITLEASDQGPNHVLAVNNGTAGTNAWDKQLHCVLSQPMVKGKTYVVKATVKADQGGDFALWPIWTTSPNRDQWGNSADVQYLAGYAMKADYQEMTWDFTASFDHDRLQFVFGKTGGIVYVDEVSCVEKGTDDEMILNGNFETDDMSAWSILSYTGQSIAVEEEAPSTAIRRVQKDVVSDHAIYSLDGRRVDARSLRPGIYVENGKKVVRK